MKWTLHAAAKEWNIHRQTLAKRLEECGHTVKAGAKFHTQVITDAITGRLEVEKIRLTKADADVREMERAEMSGKLVPVELAEKVIAQVLGPVRSKLSAMASTLALRCNPSDPDLARRELESFANEILTHASNPKIKT